MQPCRQSYFEGCIGAVLGLLFGLIVAVLLSAWVGWQVYRQFVPPAAQTIVVQGMPPLVVAPTLPTPRPTDTPVYVLVTATPTVTCTPTPKK